MKTKRTRAMKTTTALKTNLDGIEKASNSAGSSILETLLFLREGNERKAEIHCVDDEQRRRDELVAQEARRLVEKADSDERRRAERLEMEERPAVTATKPDPAPRSLSC